MRLQDDGTDIDHEYETAALAITDDIFAFLKDRYNIPADFNPNKSIFIGLGTSQIVSLALYYIQDPDLASMILEKVPSLHGPQVMPFISGPEREGGECKGLTIVYLPDQTIVDTVDGTMQDRYIFVEEISHALFHVLQIQKHGKFAGSTFVEFIGALDKVHYQLTRNADLKRSHAVQNFVITSPGSGAFSARNQETLQKPGKEHYYFAHKWAFNCFFFLIELSRKDPQAHEEFSTKLYYGTDSDRMRLLFQEMPRLAGKHRIALKFDKPFDSSNPLEIQVFEEIVRKIGDTKIRVVNGELEMDS